MAQVGAQKRQSEPWTPFQPAARVLEFEPRRPDAAGRCLVRFVAAARGVPARSLLLPNRGEAEVALARQLAMYLMHVTLGRIYQDVGHFFGRDRTTVSHACALIEDLRDDPQFDDEVSRLERRLSMRREVRRAARS